MKSERGSQWWGRWCGCAVAAGLALFAVGARAEQPGPEQIRNELRNLERKAHELKDAGKHEEAEAVVREARGLHEKLVRMEKEGRAEPALEERRVGLQRKLKEAQAYLKELREAGKEDQAAEVRRHVERLEQELARLGRQGEREGGPRPDQQRAEAERRLRHVREAIGNLRAAGMQDAAERLTHEAERMDQQFRAAAPERRDAPPSGGEIERLRAELQELRQAVRQLQARLDGQDRHRPAAKEE